MSHRKSKRTFVKESTSKSSSASTTRKHVICDCNLCQGASVNPCTRASHMKKVELTKGLAALRSMYKQCWCGTMSHRIFNVLDVLDRTYSGHVLAILFKIIFI